MLWLSWQKEPVGLDEWESSWQKEGIRNKETEGSATSTEHSRVPGSMETASASTLALTPLCALLSLGRLEQRLHTDLGTDEAEAFTEESGTAKFLFFKSAY